MTRIDATIISQKNLCVISVYGLFRFFMKMSYLECRKNNKIRKTSSVTNLPDLYFRYSLNILNMVLYGQHLFSKIIKRCIQFIHIIIFMFNRKLNDQILSGAIGKRVSCTPKQLLCIIHIKLQTNTKCHRRFFLRLIIF